MSNPENPSSPEQLPGTKEVLGLEALLSGHIGSWDTEADAAFGRLIEIFDSPWNSPSVRAAAAAVVARIASEDRSALELLIRNAKRYLELQSIDDASPYSPNAVELLGILRPIPTDAVVLLTQVLREHGGAVARFAAIESLCAMESHAADDVLKEILRGSYPSRDTRLECDRIRQLRLLST